MSFITGYMLGKMAGDDDGYYQSHSLEQQNKRLKRKIDILENRLEIAKEALEYYAQCKHLNLDILAMLLEKHKKEFADFEVYEDGEHARQALKEMEGVK